MIRAEVLRAIVKVVRTKHGETKGTGSGTIISRGGLVLTNNHVVQDLNFGAALDSLSVLMLAEVDRPAAQCLRAQLIIRNEALDLAVLRVLDSSISDHFDLFACPTLEFPSLGDRVDVLGFPPVGGATLTLTRGIVSGFDENGNIKTDAEINFGNSGGAGIDAKGNFLGVPSFIMSDNGGKIGYMIPVSRVLAWLDSIQIEKSTSYSANLDESLVFERLRYDRDNLDISPNYPRILTKFAAVEMLLRAGQYEQIPRLIGAILLKRQNSPLAHHYLGCALLATNQYVDAANEFRISLAYAPDYIPALGNLGTTLAHLGRYTEALQAFEQILSQTDDPSWLSASYINIAKLYRDAGMCELADTYLVKGA